MSIERNIRNGLDDVLVRSARTEKPECACLSCQSSGPRLSVKPSLSVRFTSPNKLVNHTEPCPPRGQRSSSSLLQ